jgi:hypothetical protein
LSEMSVSHRNSFLSLTSQPAVNKKIKDKQKHPHGEVGSTRPLTNELPTYITLCDMQRECAIATPWRSPISARSLTRAWPGACQRGQKMID